MVMNVYHVRRFLSCLVAFKMAEMILKITHVRDRLPQQKELRILEKSVIWSDPTNGLEFLQLIKLELTKNALKSKQK